VVVIADEAVAALHATALVTSLRDAGKSVSLQVVPPGEESKVLSMAAMLYGRLLEHGVDRHDLIVALGGGVVCDLAGFVASTFLRGIPHLQVPTTTLAAIDATIGGKTALHAPFGKNLIGTTYPPKAVLIAGTHLASQPRREHTAGLVEALKLAATLDATLFDTIGREASRLLACAEPTLNVLRRAVVLKADLLGRHDFVAGERTVLSFGHCVGEAIEAGAEHRLLHGEAVALGMLAETEWAEAEGWCAGISGALATVVRALGLSNDWRACAIDERGIGGEAKRRGSNLRLAYVPRIGSHEVRTVPAAALIEFVRRRRTP
jgi:3-dehydroquinate synthase